ncbi:hypothetical protein RSAG8_02882, partial [Rhizoctonia solani AG-8 WAC10335]
ILWTSSESTSSAITSTSASRTSSTSQALQSQFSFLTASSLVLPTMSTTSTSTQPTVIQTDPDAAMTTSTPATTQSGTPTTTIAFPSALPTRIVPVGGVNPEKDTDQLKGYSLISLLFTNQLSWVFVTQHAEATGQLFAYTPQMIETALGLGDNQVKTFALQAFTPASFTGDASEIRTMFLAYIPSDQSPLYSDQTSTIPAQLASLLDPSLPINAVSTGSSGTTTPSSGSNPSGSNGQTNVESTTDKSRRDAIIGVCTAFGVVFAAVIGFFIYKKAQRKREQAHRPISPMYERGGRTPEDRPRSFFFAEDSLRGYPNAAGAHAVTDDYNYRQAPSHRRVPIQTSAISAPVLRESSLNW